jgi:excisionase family DNA binding protein
MVYHVGTGTVGGHVERELLSVAEACEVLGLGEWTVKQLIRSGALASVKIRDRRLIPRQAIREYIERLLAEARAASGA